jgi:hypothetical protein
VGPPGGTVVEVVDEDVDRGSVVVVVVIVEVVVVDSGSVEVGSGTVTVTVGSGADVGNAVGIGIGVVAETFGADVHATTANINTETTLLRNITL